MLRALQFASNIHLSIRSLRGTGDDWYYSGRRMTENPRTGQSWTIDDLNRFNVGFNHRRAYAAQETSQGRVEESTPEAGQQEYQRVHQGTTLSESRAEVRQEEGAQDGRGSRAQIDWPRSEAEITPEGETIITERTTYNGRTIIDRFRVGLDGMYTHISRDIQYDEDRDVFRIDPNRSDPWRVVGSVLR